MHEQLVTDQKHSKMTHANKNVLKNNETMQPITALNRLGTPSILFKKLDENDETAIFCKFWSKGGYFEDKFTINT